MSSRYVLQVAISQRPSAETSTPMIGSPRAGSAVYVFCFSRDASYRPHLGVLSDLIKETNVSFVACNSHFPGFGRGGGREIVLRRILLELTLHELESRDTGVYSEEAVVR